MKVYEKIIKNKNMYKDIKSAKLFKKMYEVSFFLSNFPIDQQTTRKEVHKLCKLNLS